MDKIAKSLEIAFSELHQLLGDRMSTSEAVRDHHSRDESWHVGQAPEAVCFANNADEVSGIMQICSRYIIPVIPFGTGTGLEGGTVARRGGICSRRLSCLLRRRRGVCG